jgi:hypothetical protein
VDAPIRVGMGRGDEQPYAPHLSVGLQTSAIINKLLITINKS